MASFRKRGDLQWQARVTRKGYVAGVLMTHLPRAFFRHVPASRDEAVH